MNATVTKQVWWDGIMVTCVDHMGMTLKCELEVHPKRKTHVTRYGEAYLITGEELVELVGLVGEEVCETCRYKAGA
jgi:hypothetical protein